MDPLSDVLSLLKPSSYMSGGFDGGGDWAVQFGPHEGIKFQAMVSGSCWLAVDGVADPVHMVEGDCLLLPRGLPFRMASDLAVPPIDSTVFLQTPLNGTVRSIHGGGSCFSIGGRITFAGRHSEVLLGALPPIVHIRKASDKAAMRWALERLMLELREPQPGSDLVSQQLAYIMLVQALRLYVTDGAGAGVGWLFALADKQMSAAMHCMHEDPSQRWTIQSLAERAGMARSSFALKFKQTVGASPMDYLTRWRMMLAADRLTHTGDPVSVLAAALGYESESAFSTAFKRVMGCAPRQYGRGRAQLGGEPVSA